MDRAGGCRMTKRLADREHGLASTYKNYGCRCESCRAAHATYTRPVVLAWRRRHAAAGLCLECSQPADGKAGRCANHHERMLLYGWNSKRRKAGMPPLTLDEFRAINGAA